MNRFDKYVIDFATKMNEGWHELTLNEKISRASQLLVRCLKRFDGCPNERTTGLSLNRVFGFESLLTLVQRMYRSVSVNTGI